jgi:recombination protein RecR
MESILPKQIRTLITEFAKIPGIGPKSAERIVFFLLKTNQSDLDTFGSSLQSLKQNIKRCTNCFNITDNDICVICEDTNRSAAQICVVEEALDIVAIEKTRQFDGRYHVLGGVISPLDGIGPEELTIHQLDKRVRNEQPQLRELILATNPSLEGEATNMYITKKLGATGIEMTRIARGLPVGGEVEYADEMTLTRALEHRVKAG